jgi:hypothetical protein
MPKPPVGGGSTGGFVGLSTCSGERGFHRNLSRVRRLFPVSGGFTGENRQSVYAAGVCVQLSLTSLLAA